MGYQEELNDYRQEIRYGASDKELVFWPKRKGENISVTSATYSIFAPSVAYDGTALETGSATKTTVDSVSKLTVTPDASDTTAWPMDENYRCEFDITTTTDVIKSILYFDVVRVPWESEISLNDLKEEVPDIEERLTRMATAIESGRTAEEHAGTVAVKAWTDVREWLRQRADHDGHSYATMITNMTSVNRIVVAQCLARVFRGESGGIDSDSRQLAIDWANEAQSRFRGLGVVQYDTNQDGAVDIVKRGWSSVRMSRRRW